MDPWQKIKKSFEKFKKFWKFLKFQNLNRRKHQIQLETFVDNFKMLKCKKLREGNKKLRE